LQLQSRVFNSTRPNLDIKSRYSTQASSSHVSLAFLFPSFLFLAGACESVNHTSFLDFQRPLIFCPCYSCTFIYVSNTSTHKPIETQAASLPHSTIRSNQSCSIGFSSRPSSSYISPSALFCLSSSSLLIHHNSTLVLSLQSRLSLLNFVSSIARKAVYTASFLGSQLTWPSAQLLYLTAFIVSSSLS
jgi:hypothetical protein